MGTRDKGLARSYTLCVVEAAESEVPYYPSRVRRVRVVVEYEIVWDCGCHDCAAEEVITDNRFRFLLLEMMWFLKSVSIE